MYTGKCYYRISSIIRYPAKRLTLRNLHSPRIRNPPNASLGSLYSPCKLQALGSIDNACSLPASGVLYSEGKFQPEGQPSDRTMIQYWGQTSTQYLGQKQCRVLGHLLSQALRKRHMQA